MGGSKGSETLAWQGIMKDALLALTGDGSTAVTAKDPQAVNCLSLFSQTLLIPSFCWSSNRSPLYLTTLAILS